MTASAPDPGRRRPSIEERAARRDRVDRVAGDRYSTLLNALRAGREIRVTGRTPEGFRWHPIARKLLVLALACVAAYLLVTVASRIWRESHSDTWSGPDQSVSSGQLLAGCAATMSRDDPVFPVWIRFRGGVFVATGYSRPFPSDPTGSYEQTAYHLERFGGGLELWRVLNTPDGLAGRQVILRLRGQEVGALYNLDPTCP